MNTTPSHCDTEQGWAECICGTAIYYTSYCSLYAYAGEVCGPEGQEHDIIHCRITEECSCNRTDPALDHPCLGHDHTTGQPIEGPSQFWRYWEIRESYRS